MEIICQENLGYFALYAKKTWHIEERIDFCMEISLEKLGVEAVKIVPDFFSEMKQGDEKAVVLNDGIVVVYRMEKRINKRRSQIVISVIESVSIDAELVDVEAEAE